MNKAVSAKNQVEPENSAAAPQTQAQTDTGGFWQAIVARMPSALLVLDAPSGRIRYCNSAAVRLLGVPAHDAADEGGVVQAAGVSEENFQGDSASGVFDVARILHAGGHPYSDDQHPLLRALYRGVETREEEVRYQHPVGFRAFLSCQTTLLRDAEGRTIAVLATFDDIAARRHAEMEMQRRYEDALDAVEALRVTEEDMLIMRAKLEEERQRYQELFHFATDGYLVTDMNGIVQEANREACARMGIPSRYAQGKILANCIHLDDRLRFRALLNQMQQETGRVDWEGELVTREGRRMDVLMTVAAMFDRVTGEAQTLRWILRDISRRREMERAREADQQRLLEQEHRAGVLEERTRIAQEFHDTLAQGFTGISYLLSTVEETLRTNPDEAEARIRRARDVAKRSVTEARAAIQAMRAETQESDNLPAALATLAEQTTQNTRIPVLMEVKGRVRLLSSAISSDLLRIAQEAVTNALKHAHATEIRLMLNCEAEQAWLTIQDNGTGFTPNGASAPSGFGLVGMRERARRIHARLDLESEPGRGTRITVQVPLSPAATL